MDPSTTAANALLQRALRNAAVESFGLSHQIPFLEFRDDEPADHILSIETEVTSNIVFDEALGLNEEEKMLLLFYRVNLRRVTHVECDDQSNLLIEFDNGVQLRFTGSQKADTYEPWQLGSRADLDSGGYRVFAQYGGGYAIWDYTTTSD